MVLVFLKNFLFSPKDSRGQRTPLSPSTPPITGYGSFQPAQHKSSVSPASGSVTPQIVESHVGIEHGLFAEPGSSTEPFATDIESLNHASSTCFSPRMISDAIIGLSDGLTVPFALTAGLSTFQDTRVVVYGGLAELIAGSISMGLGGWLAARGERYPSLYPRFIRFGIVLTLVHYMQ